MSQTNGGQAKVGQATVSQATVQRGSFARDFGLAARQFKREFRLSEYLVLIFALVLSVAAVTSVGFFANRVEKAMGSQAATLLAADAVVDSQRPIDSAAYERAKSDALNTADIVEFPSVVLTEDGETSLVAVKAISAQYPLRGDLKLSSELYGDERSSVGAPASGSVWIDPRLAGALQVKVGDTLLFGDGEVTITALISFEPDRSADIFQLGPRLIMPFEDIDASGLLGEGSRARYKLLLAGNEQQIDSFSGWFEDNSDAYLSLETVEDGRPAVRSALVNAKRFLGLAAAVAVLLSAAAVSLAARQIAERDMNTSSLMRTFGAQRSTVLRVVILRLGLIALLSVVLGCVIGYIAQYGLSALLGQWFSAELPAPSMMPLVGGLGCALLALGGFCLPSVVRAVDTPVLSVLRRDLPLSKPSTLLAVASALIALCILLIWLTQDLQLGVLLLLGMLVVVGVLMAISRLLVWLAGRAQSPFLRRSLESLRKRPQSVSLQIAAFSVGLLAIMLLTIVRNDVLDAWQRQVPDDAPNFFLVNIQPDEVEPLQSFLTARGVVESNVYPMIRGRLESINDVPVAEIEFSEHGKRFATRDQNISYLDLPRAGRSTTVPCSG